MINMDRIVPVTATDLLSLYGLILLQDSNNSGLAKLASDGIGKFSVTTNSAKYIASEPVKELDIDATASSVSASTIFFVPAYDFKGFTVDGDAVTATGDVDADGRTLYKATWGSSTLTFAKVGF